MTPNFHLSLGVQSIDESIDFFVTLLDAKVVHRDPSGYVNIDLYGNQITLKLSTDIVPRLPHFHFGINLSLAQFDELSQKILSSGTRYIAAAPEIWDANTPLERKKMYLKCPTGYLVELKGYTIPNSAKCPAGNSLTL